MIGFGCPTGVIHYNKEKCFNGYTVVPPFFDTNTYLIDMEGKIVHQWPSKYFPMAAYLEPDGTLTRQGRVENPVIRYGGVTGIIEQIDWDGNVIWSFELNDDEHGVLSHNTVTLPNGNIMAKVEKMIPAEEVYAKGRISGTLEPEMVTGRVHDGLSNDIIVEIDKKTKEIIYAWSAFEHAGDNAYQKISLNNPEGNNYGRTSGCWVNFNGIDYNPKEDEFMVTSRQQSEIYIISRKTNRIVWRWGNPANYGKGRKPSFTDDGDQQLFGPHNPTFLPNGNVQVFDNGWCRPQGNRSRVLEIDRTTGKVVWQYEANRPFNFNSPFQSNAQRLPNGNVFVCATAGGQLFEVTGGKNPRVVWEFTSPWILNNQTTHFLTDSHAIPNREVCDNSAPDNNLQNFIHRSYRYGADFSGFKGKDLSKAKEINPRIQHWWEMEPWKSGFEEADKLGVENIHFVPTDGENVK